MDNSTPKTQNPKQSLFYSTQHPKPKTQNFFKGVYAKKKVLVTGHTGFKGSWLTIWLMKLGADIAGYALEPKTSRDNYVLSGLEKRVKNYIADVRDKDTLNKIFKDEQPEVVFHLAAQPLVISSYEQPVETYETNIMGTVNLLEACRLTESVKQIIIITSDKCYENREWIWGYREDDILGGYDPYSSSKAAVEIVCNGYRNSFFHPDKFSEHQKSLATVRAGNVIGGGDWAEYRIIPDCICALEGGEEIKIRNPQATRPWQHVLEPLGGYLLLAAKMMDDPVKFAEAWNFGPYQESIVTVKRLVETVIGNYGKGKWRDISDPESPHEAGLLALDISKAYHRLNWRPVFSFDETIQLTVEWYKKYSAENVYDLCVQQIKAYMERWNKLQ